ncbi:trimeric intracellular cation channel family protein [Litorihabitans aurantiacus]|uniref:Glycine transporter domain-containing protein n=1 Tax=Litorihabitans aurantiacus TaxID=1930061 RepID=A0AA37XE12_9MICO|nr:TRIC cation channel family protein [Litorihabitans aurantiacus]GMA31426.1 hypothetical protein GCM10025875_14180 [Litorihabitans aurantiacus]
MVTPDLLASGGATVASASVELVRVLDLLGVAANVVLAALLAREKKFDLVGFLVLGVAAGLGGGMIRDTLLQRGTPVALTDLSYLSVALATAVLAYLVHVEGRWWRRGARVLDAIALGTWGAVGAQRAITAGLHWLPALMLGTITAVGGGMVRDVLLHRTPIVFGGNTLYATCATAAAGVVVLADWMTSSEYQGLTTLLAAVVGGTLCLVSYRLGWRLPEARDWRPRGRAQRRGGAA